MKKVDFQETSMLFSILILQIMHCAKQKVCVVPRAVLFFVVIEYTGELCAIILK